MNIDPLKNKVTPFQRLWHRWKSLKSVPFRKKWFVGYDLDGNTYWEFSNVNNPVGRLRRIVQYREKKGNFTDYKLPPMWLQWLRHTRRESPSLFHLIAEEQRQEAMKILAQRADERWKKESMIENDKRIMAERMRNVHQAVGASESDDKKEKRPQLKVEEESPIQEAKIQPRR